MGSTGPVLVFETILFNFSKQYEIDYIGFRAWVGLWTALILVLIVLTDCSALVKYITRFTEESFASLIAIIFIKESIFKLIDINKIKHSSNDPMEYFLEHNQNPDCFHCVRLADNGTLVENQTGTELLNEIQVKCLNYLGRIINSRANFIIINI